MPEANRCHYIYSVLLLCIALYVTAVRGVVRPIPLLVPDHTRTRLVIDTRGIDALRAFGTQKVAIVTFVGRARSGKSFSLNQMIGVDHGDGFEVGHTDRPKTHGASIWPSPVGACSDGFVHVAIDTEGVGAGMQTYDKALLLVALVLSSRIVYHNSGWVHTEDVTRIYSLTCLAQHYDRRGMLNNAGVRGELIPPMSWIVQRYTLERDQRTESTERDVLFNVWLGEQANPTGDQHIARFNATVHAVKTLFPSHSVHLIPEAADATKYRYLTDVPQDELSPQYREAMRRAREEIFSCEHTRPRNGGLTGNDIASLLLDIIEAANEGVEFVGDKVADGIARAIVADEAAKLESTIEAELTLPDSTVDIDAILSAKHGLATASLTDALARAGIPAGIARPYHAELAVKFAGVKERIHFRNSVASDLRCASAAAVAVSRFESAQSLRMFGGDLGAFDDAVTEAIIKYAETAVGPAEATHRAALISRTNAARLFVASEGAPRRKMIWAFGSLAVIIASTAISRLVALAGAWFLPSVFSTAFNIACVSTSLAAAATMVVSGWSVVSPSPLVDFDSFADSVTSGFRIAKPVVPFATLVLIGWYIYTTFVDKKNKVAFEEPIKHDVEVHEDAVLSK